MEALCDVHIIHNENKIHYIEYAYSPRYLPFSMIHMDLE